MKLSQHDLLTPSFRTNPSPFRDLARSQTSPLPRLVLIAFVFVAHALLYFSALGSDAVDDAYISFRYAQNAILGYGLVFNPGERVEGFTNFLWTVLMIPLEGMGVDLGRASILLGAVFAAGLLWLMVRFARVVGERPGVGLFAALLLAVDGSFALWAVGGLETAMFSFLIFAGALLYVREQREDTWPYSGVFFALAAMTRPEGVMVFGLTVAHQAAWRLVSERRLVAGRDVGRVFAFLALFIPYWLGRWSYYHSFLPNSFHAKVSPSGPEAQLERGWNHLSQFVGVHLGWLILLPPVVAVVNAVRGLRPLSLRGARSATKQSPNRRDEIASSHPSTPLRTLLAMTGETDRSARDVVPRLFWATYFALILIAYGGYIVYVGGDWSVGRFFMPLLAPFYFLFSTGVDDVYTWVGQKLGNRELTRIDPNDLGVNSRYSRMDALRPAASLAFAALVLFASSWNGEYGIFIRGFNAGTATEAREAMGRWLRANAPRGTWIAVDAAGQVPYFSGLPAIDMFGINDLHIGRLPVATLGQGTPGHEKFDLGYVIARAPTYVVIYGTLFDGVKEYERAPATWTTQPEYLKFLTLYVRRP